MKNKEIGFNFLGVKTEQFALLEENFNKKNEVSLGSDLEFKLNCEKKQLGIFATFRFEQAKTAFLKLQISCHFQVVSESWDNYCGDNKIVFPKDFMAHLSMLTVGTARGVLHAKTEGTGFNRFMLPLINVADLVKSDVVFNLSE